MRGGATQRREQLAIALVSAAVMLYELGVTRVLSVVVWYHFAFLAVSLAMLGLGAPGVLFSLKEPREGWLSGTLIAAGIAAPASVAILFRYGNVVSYRTPLATACILVTMLFLGSAVCLLLMRARGRAIAAMYAADLAGATIGAIAVVPLMHHVPTPLIVAGSGLLPLLANLCIAGRSSVTVAALVVVAGTLVWGEPYRLRYVKYYDEPGELLHESWTPTARLSVIPTVFFHESPGSAFGWGMGSKYVPRPLDQLWLEQDGSAGTPISRFAGSWSSVDHLLFDVTSAGYQIQPSPEACIIGAGGGRDILAALLAGSKRVDAVELNGKIVDLVSREFRAFSGAVYDLPGVRAIVSEGRSYLTRTDRRYDAIQISLVDSWAATTAGAFALSENFLYTVEAYRLYWSRLTPDGILSTSRWVAGEHLLETLRLTLLVQEALRREGVADPLAHVAIVQGGMVANVLVSRRPFTGALLASLSRVCASRGFQRHWPHDPRVDGRAPLASLIRDGGSKLKSEGIDLTPPEDDRPFFFHTVPVWGKVNLERVSLLSVNETSTVMLRRLLIGVSAVAAALFFLPFLASRRFERGRGLWTGSIYFVVIGLAFMAIEIPLMQRSVLYLGHPSYATTVVLSGVLLGASCGSSFASALGGRSMRRLGFVPALVLAALTAALGPLFESTPGSSLAVRAILTVAVVGPMGFCMGLAFPGGMIRFGERNRPWYWAVNGFASVAASIVSQALVMTFGFTPVMYAGAAAYLVAWGVLLLAPADEPAAIDGKPNLI